VKKPSTKNKKEELSYRGVRCGICYWALYDGDYCQNPKCKVYGKSVNENRIYLTNQEAFALIRSSILR